MLLENRALEQLRSGQLAIGVGLRQARTVDIAKAMNTVGFDWMFIDMEHNSMSIDIAVQISVAAHAVGITPIVRVPGHEHYHASRALDGGAQGIVVPHVDDANTAKQIVSNCKYPPLGHRSLASALPQLSFETLPPAEATEMINQSTAVVVMLETPDAIENAEEIAAVDGVDVLMIGANDLCLELGIPGEYGNPTVVSACEHVFAACAKYKKYPGIGGIYAPELIEQYIKLGARWVLAGADLGFLMAGAREQASRVRKMLV